MYGVRAARGWRSAIRSGPTDQFGDLIRRFLERCDDFGGVPVFYEVGKDHLHRYADFGLTFVKLGEEAKVDLTTFTLEGGRRAKYRQALRRLEKDGGSFRVVDAGGGAGGHATTARASRTTGWRRRPAAEKGFSLGFFDEAYLSRFPVAVIERGGQIEAFANLWPGPSGEELSIDLMRYHRDAPKSVMEGLFVHLMLWGQRAGLPAVRARHGAAVGLRDARRSRRCGTGSARSSTSTARRSTTSRDCAPTRRSSTRSGSRATWPIRAGCGCRGILADVSALVAGGYRQIFRK